MSCYHETHNNNINNNLEMEGGLLSACSIRCNTIPFFRASFVLMHPKKASYLITGCAEEFKETPWKITAWGCSLSEFIN